MFQRKRTQPPNEANHDEQHIQKAKSFKQPQKVWTENKSKWETCLFFARKDMNSEFWWSFLWCASDYACISWASLIPISASFPDHSASSRKTASCRCVNFSEQQKCKSAQNFAFLTKVFPSSKHTPAGLIFWILQIGLSLAVRFLVAKHSGSSFLQKLSSERMKAQMSLFALIKDTFSWGRIARNCYQLKP